MKDDPDYQTPADRGLSPAEQKELKDGESFWNRLLCGLALATMISAFGLIFGFWQLARWLSGKH